MMRILLLISLLITFFSGAFLFHVKQEVLALEKTLKTLTQNIELTEEQMKVLKSEWAYLTHPKRINELALRYLEGSKILGQDQLLPMPTPHSGVKPALDPKP
jgi:hypothetical protein